MKLLYIAGPFSHPDPIHGVEYNVLVASRIALEAARAGWMPVCPHKNTAGFQHATDIPASHWYRGTLDLMRKCDAVLMIPGWRTSSGAGAEYLEAKKAGMKILHYDGYGIPAPGEVCR